jgi:AsmA protein
MPKILKLTLGSLLALLLLVAVALVAALVFIDPNDYKDDITGAVHDATGRQLTLAGDIELSVFPWLGLTLGEAALSNAPGFGAEPFARVSAVDIKVKLLPLLQKRVEMKTVRLQGLQVALAKDKDGRSNWDDLLAPPAAAEAPKAEEKPAAEQPPQAHPLAALAIGGIELSDARVVWDDQQSGQRVQLDKLALTTGPLSLTDPIDLTLTTNMALKQPALQTPLKLAGQVAFDLAAQRYTVKGLKLELNASGEVLPVSPLAATLAAEIDTDLAAQRLTVRGLQVAMLGTTLGGDVQVEQLMAAPQATGSIALAAFSPRELVAKLGLPVPQTSDAKALTRAKLNTDFSASLEAATLDKLVLMLDDTQLSGQASVSHFDQPALRFALTVNEIDADRYLPPPAQQTTAPPAPAAAAVGAAQLPLDMLRALDVDGNLQLGKLKLANAHLAEIALRIKAKDGMLRLHPLAAQLYGGRYDGNIALDVRSDTPRIALDEKLASVNVGPLLKDLLGDDKVSGVANVSAQLSATGIEPDAVMKTLNGTAQFSFQDGAVKGVNLGQLIREAYAKVKKKPAPPKTTNETDFAEMSGSVKVTNGVVRNDDLQAKSPLLRIAGKGSVDLPKQRIDYLVNASLVESGEGQAGKELEELKALTIPVKVSGSFSDPKFKLDLEPILKAKARQEVERQKQKLQDKVDKKVEEEKQRLRDKLKDKLKSLF